MPDIFLSYSREDQATARRFAEALQREGFDVWWDQSLRSGESYDEVTEQALKGARAVVVLWSKTSVASRWVRAEATIADRAGTLVPVMIEPCERPVMFELRQSADLSGWQGAADPRWSSFIGDLRHRLQRPEVPRGAATPTGIASTRRIPAVVIGVIALIAALAGAWMLRPQRASDSPQAATRPVTLAVLPFENLSSDKEQEFFADGLTEELLNSLARVDGLQVTSRTSAFFFKGRREELRTIGERLGVDHLLEGSVRRDGEQLRISAQLIKASDGFHLWSQTYNRPLKDVFKVQEEIARSVAQALQVTLGVGDLGVLPGMTRDVQAYEAYLEGVTLRRQNAPAPMLRARDQFERAVSLDSSFMLAWLELSNAYRGLAMSDVGPGGTALRAKADVAFATARKLSNDAQFVRALDIARELPRGDWSGVEKGRSLLESASKDYRHASAELEFDAFDIQSLAVDKSGRAIPSLERARSQDPLNLRVAVNLAGAYAYHGRLADAAAEIDRGLAISSSNPLLAFHNVTLARAMGDAGRLEAAWELLAQADPGNELVVEMHALRHRPADARKALRTRAASPGSASPLLQIAQFAAYFDDPETALRVLQSHDNPELKIVIAQTSWRPHMAEVRRLPGFKDHVRRLGLVDYWREFGWGEHCKPLGDTDFECR